jgi:hypothetical protein
MTTMSSKVSFKIDRIMIFVTNPITKMLKRRLAMDRIILKPQIIFVDMKTFTIYGVDQ